MGNVRQSRIRLCRRKWEMGNGKSEVGRRKEENRFFAYFRLALGFSYLEELLSRVPMVLRFRSV